MPDGTTPIETNASPATLVEHIEQLVDEQIATVAQIAGLKAYMKRLKVKLDGLEVHEKDVRRRMLRAMEAEKKPSVRLAHCLVSIVPVAPALQIVDEAKIPAEYWSEEVTATLNKAELLDDLKKGAVVDGVSLNNGGVTIRINKE